MKVECTRGFHSVEHPKTGEVIIVEDSFETDRETFELLREEYSGFVEVEKPECGVGGCSRSVDNPEETCWQHPEDGED